jgi:tetratricopeptide (TPR) repeat protein
LAILPATRALAGPLDHATHPDGRPQGLSAIELLVHEWRDAAAATAERAWFTQLEARATAMLPEDERRARSLVVEAKRLIVDAFPEDRTRAELLLVDAIRLAPRYVEAYADLSRYTLWQISNGLKEPAEIQRAALLAAHVRELAHTRPLGNFLVCEILLAMGQTSQAAALFNETARRWPDHLDTRVFEARYWSEADPERAIASAQDALGRGHPMDDLSPAIALAVTNADSKAGNDGVAKNVGSRLARFATVYPDRWLWHRAALAFSEEGAHDRARDAYRRAVALGNDMEARLQLGVLEYSVLRDYDDASRNLERVRQVLDDRARERGSAALQSDSRALVLSHLALARLESGDETRARETGADALVAGMRNPNILVPLTEEFMRRKKGELLRPGLEEVARRDPLQEYVHVTLGNLASARKDLEAAFDHFGAAIALQPERDDLFSARGHVAYKALRYDAALRDFERASKLRPDQATHHYNRACMLSLLGRKDEALVSLREALSMNGQLREVASRDADLEPLRGDESFASQLATLGLLSADHEAVPGPVELTPEMQSAQSQPEGADESSALP